VRKEWIMREDLRRVFIECGRGPAKIVECQSGTEIKCPWCGTGTVTAMIDNRCNNKDCGSRVCGLMALQSYEIK
jgi:hypothetical protein